MDQLREDGAYDVVTSFLVVHEIDPALKAAAFAAVAKPLGVLSIGFEPATGGLEERGGMFTSVS